MVKSLKGVGCLSDVSNAVAILRPPPGQLDRPLDLHIGANNLDVDRFTHGACGDRVVDLIPAGQRVLFRSDVECIWNRSDLDAASAVLATGFRFRGSLGTLGPGRYGSVHRAKKAQGSCNLSKAGL
jgi:hypothetical protein